MTQLVFTPEQYWNVNDERITILKKYLDSFDVDDSELLSTEEIISRCINKLKEFQLNEGDRLKLRDLILCQNGLILTPCIEEICKELLTLNSHELTLISLGCGNESLFERTLHDGIHKRLPNVNVRWLGLDVGDFRDANSFFQEQPFKVITESSSIQYASFVDDRNIPIVLVGRYSFHHIGIEYLEFLKRCVGIDRVILVEEPTTTDLWNLQDYRFMRIAYDVLANTVFVVNWAKAFIEEPDLFKINYIKTNELPKGTNITEFSAVLPETALIVSEPKKGIRNEY